MPWKNLIILDACRYDAFRDTYKKYFKGTLLKVKSPATCTRDWLRETWTENYPDITYISCNTFMRSRKANLTHAEHIHEYGHGERFKRVIDAWIEGLMPEHIEKYALTTKGRKVLHYNFPHQPYHGKVKTGDYQGYLSNLEYILEYLVDFIPRLNGTTIITADHGELFSGHGIIHPCSGMYDDDPRLREIPWFIVYK